MLIPILVILLCTYICGFLHSSTYFVRYIIKIIKQLNDTYSRMYLFNPYSEFNTY